MRSLTVTLPDDVIDDIEARVAAGEYASESDLVRDSLESSIGSDFELDGDQIARIRASYDEMQSDPSRAIPIEQIMDRLRTRAIGSD